MEKDKLEEYVDLLMSMSLDFKMGHIDKELYLTNLKLIVSCITEQKILQ